MIAEQLLKSLRVDQSTLPEQSYFHSEWVEFRSHFWANHSTEYESQVPLLQLSREFDFKTHLSDLLVLGNKVGVNPSASGSQWCVRLRDDATDPFTNYLCRENARCEKQSAFDEYLFVEGDFLNEPRFLIGRSAYADFALSLPFISEDDLGLNRPERSDCSPFQHPASSWFEQATIRYSGGRSERDFQLCKLLVGSMLALPAMVLWKRCFEIEDQIDSSPTGLEAMLTIIFQLQFNPCVWIEQFAKLGVCLKHIQYDATNAFFTPLPDLTESEQLVLRLLVPPKHLQLFFTLDVSELDSSAVLV